MSDQFEAKGASVFDHKTGRVTQCASAEDAKREAEWLNADDSAERDQLAVTERE